MSVTAQGCPRERSFRNARAGDAFPERPERWLSAELDSPGYKAFQLKFSPMLVQRAMSDDSRPAGHTATAPHRARAPLYSKGLFHATKKRRIIAWSIYSGVALMVGLVKRLSYP